MLPNDLKPMIIVIMTVTFLMIYVDTAVEADDKFSVAPYMTITTGNGEPVHDIARIGLQGRHRLSHNLYLTTTID